MLIRNATAFVDGRFCPGMEVRVHNGRVQEIGQGLYNGLYEDAIDLGGDYLLPGFVEAHIQGYRGHDALQGEAAVRAMSRDLFRVGVAAFCPAIGGASAQEAASAMEAVRRVMAQPEHHGAVVLGVHLEADALAGAASTMRKVFEEMLSRGVKPEDAVLLCTAAPADSVGEKLAGRIAAGAPSPLTRWSRAWQWKGILA